MDSRAGIFNLDTLQNLVSNAVSRPRLYAMLLGTFAAIAVVLAAVGIYGVLTYSVAERRREIGIRMALGARSSDVLALVLGQTGILTLAGIALGLAAAAGVTRYLDWMLFGLVPLDPMTFGVVAVDVRCRRDHRHTRASAPRNTSGSPDRASLKETLMSAWRRFVLRLRNFVRFDSADRELAREICRHTSSCSKTSFDAAA